MQFDRRLRSLQIARLAVGVLCVCAAALVVDLSVSASRTAVTLSYPSPDVFRLGVNITPLVPSTTGKGLRFRISPALPAGLFFSRKSGIITGTPSSSSPLAVYQVTASNERGSATFALSLSVIDSAAPSALQYNTPPIFLAGNAISPMAPSVVGNVTLFSVNPALPTGLAINPSTGVISGTPTEVTASAWYTVTAANAAGSASAALELTVDSGPTVHLAATVSDPNGLTLTYRWQTTDGELLNINGPEADWKLPSGYGLHFAYLLVSNGQGGYAEERLVVNTDNIGNPVLTTTPVDWAAPPSTTPTGYPYRSYVQAGSTASDYFPGLSEGSHAVLVSGIGVHILDRANNSVEIANGVSNQRGEYVIPNLPVGSTYQASCWNAYGIFSNTFCTSDSALQAGNLNLVTLPLALTDWYPGGETYAWPWIVGSMKLADGNPCGRSDAFFGLTPTGTVSLLDASGALVTIAPQFTPVSVSEYGDFAMPMSTAADSLQYYNATQIQFSCEGATPVTVPIPSTLSYTASYDFGPVVMPGTAVPAIGTITATYQNQQIALFPPPPPATPQPAPASNVNPRSTAFLGFKGIDSRMGACQYYKAVGAVKSCDANGNPSGGITFDDWMRTVKIGQYAIPGTPEYTATYINKVDLNLTRVHHSISYNSGQTAAYVCNHAGPSVLDPQQAEIDSVIDDAVANKKLVACVAMDYSVTPGVNLDTNGVAQPFTRFLIFGPNGSLLLSINLDGRGEKFVPGSCVACHGGDYYAGHYPEDGSGRANIGAHFLPYDTGNFEFSSKAGLTLADQQEAIYLLNQNVLNAGPTVAEQELISGWYASSHVLDPAYVPASWQTASPKMVSYYKAIYARSCRTCHVAMTEGYNFDHYANYQAPSGTYRSTSGVAPTMTAQCGPNYELPHVAYSMPNSLVTFNRFWAQFGSPSSTAARTACNSATNPF